jgi:hypothetical protein
MHDLKAQQFYEPKLVNGRYDVAGGMTKTFPLRGIKDSPPYLHDGRLLTLEDTVEYFNLIFELKLNQQEKTGHRGVHEGALESCSPLPDVSGRGASRRSLTPSENFFENLLANVLSGSIYSPYKH